MKYWVHEIGDKTWMIEEGNGVDRLTHVYMYLLAGEKEAALIDGGMGQIPLDRIVRELTDLPVKMLLTHGHIDHIGAASMFEEVYMHDADRDTYQEHVTVVRERYEGDFPPPAKHIRSMKEGDLFDLGGRTLQVIETPGHTSGSVCILDMERKELYTGDTCCKAHVLLNMKFCETLECYYGSLKKLKSRRAEYSVTWPGHHARPVEPEIVDQFMEGAESILDGSAELRTIVHSGRPARILEHRDIGIVLPAE